MAEFGYFVVPPEDGRFGQAFILVNDVYVEQCRNETSIRTRSRRTNRDTKQYLKGTLLREVQIDEPVEGKVLCRNPESEVYFYCATKDLKEITENIFELLLAISNCRDRLDVFRDKNRLAEGLEMDIGHEVSVKVPSYAEEMRGVIRYKGVVNGKDGIQFGIELFNPEGRGISNGTYGKERYFQCDAEAGVFLPLNRVSPIRNRNQLYSSAPRKSKQSRMSSGASGSRARPSTESGPTFVHNITKEELATLGIRHGMEVCIFTEVKGRESQEKGKVKFIGRLPGSNGGNTIYVGIDLYNPVGNGTGLYNGKHLFYTKQNHAALVPLSGVLPAYVTDIPTPAEGVRSRNDRSNSNSPTEMSSRRNHRGYNSTPDVTPATHPQKTFVQSASQAGRGVHSSPSVLGAGRAINPEHREELSRSQQRSLQRSANSQIITSADLYGHAGNTANNEYKDSKSGSQMKVSARRPLRDFDDNSGDETDLYGSDNSVAAKQSLANKEYAGIERRMSPMSRAPPQQVRNVASMPGVPPIPMAERASRNVRTVPAYGVRLPAEIVDINAITDKISNTAPTPSPMEIDNMEVGTMVEVNREALGQDADPGANYGVIKWIGKLPNNENDDAAGVELERPISNGTDGTFNGVRYFSCDSGRGHFVFLKFCKRDPRFLTPVPGAMANMELVPMPRDFGSYDSPEVGGEVSPPMKLVSSMVGKKRGIQGHHNSCYLDSTLFSLFAYSQVLDTILFRPRRETDLPDYEETQKVLKDLIINPLRKHHFVRADRIMQLRELLDKLGSTTGLVNEEKDPEEFLNTLLHQVFKAEPLHELRQGDSNAAHEGFFYQIFMERDEKFVCPTTQQLLEKSLISADLKFRNVPVCLILQMPRFGKDYKMYKRLKPSLQLDITDLVEDMPRSCDVCEAYAEFECRDCFMEGSMNDSNSSFCKECAQRVHNHRRRMNHNYRAIKLPDEFREYAENQIAKGKKPIVQRQTLELFAVVCIATSHYVSFAKCGTGKKSSWVFFDSMADRVGEQNGYNIPEVTMCQQVEEWLNQDENNILHEDEKLMPELKRRLLCDSYMCMYQSRELMFNK